MMGVLTKDKKLRRPGTGKWPQTCPHGCPCWLWSEREMYVHIMAKHK